MIKEQTNFSKNLYGINWMIELPQSLGEYQLEISNLQEFLQLKNQEDSFITTSDTSSDFFFKERENSKKLNYLQQVADFFVIKFNTTPVGVVICEFSDWCTYYLRFIFIDKNHRGKNLTIEFVKVIENCLRKYDVDKICCEVSSGNFDQIARMSYLGFFCSGTRLSERFGSLIYMTKYLKEDQEIIFQRQFNQSFRQVNKRKRLNYLPKIKEAV